MELKIMFITLVFGIVLLLCAVLYYTNRKEAKDCFNAVFFGSIAVCFIFLSGMLYAKYDILESIKQYEKIKHIPGKKIQV